MDYNKNSKDNKVNEAKTSLVDDEASKSIEDITNIISNVNVIKEELCKIPLDPCEKEIFENNLLPMLNLLSSLSNVSVNLANSANTLTNSTIVFRKKSDIKDTIDLVYDINKKCKKVYEILEKRIDKFIY